MRRKPGELKHLSSRRKRKKFDSLSSGERKGKSPNHASAWGCGPSKWLIRITEHDWNVGPKRVKVP